MSRHSISSLLNPCPLDRCDASANNHVDICAQLNAISRFSCLGGRILAPPTLQASLSQVLMYLNSNYPIPAPDESSLGPSSPATSHPTSPFREPTSSGPPSPSASSVEPAIPSVQYQVYLNRVTTLSKLFSYPVDAFVEYPETCNSGQSVGHLFHLDPSKWQAPVRNFAYSLGSPSGRTLKGNEVFCRLLVDQENKTVPCIKRHYTCM